MYILYVQSNISISISINIYCINVFYNILYTHNIIYYIIF